MSADTDMVEKVARAIAHARSWQTTALTVGDWDDRSTGERQPFLEMARAALDARRQTPNPHRETPMPDKEQSPSVTVEHRPWTEREEGALRDHWRKLSAGAYTAGDDWAVRYLWEHFTRPTPDLGKDEDLVEQLLAAESDASCDQGTNEDRELAEELKARLLARLEALHAEREKLREALEQAYARPVKLGDDGNVCIAALSGKDSPDAP